MFLGKLVAGAALGGAALLITTPGLAQADESPDPRDSGYHADRGRNDHEGYVVTYPRIVKPGHEVTLTEICKKPQRHAWVWSEPTGKVGLKPRHPREEDGTGDLDPSGGTGGAATDADADAEAEAEETYGGTESTGDEQTGTDEATDGRDGPDGKDGRDDKDGHDDKDGTEHKRLFVYWAKVRIPGTEHPGHYKLKGSCGDGKLMIAPNGAVAGGDGGAGTDTGLALSGAGMLGAAALGGVALLRRRRGDATLA